MIRDLFEFLIKSGLLTVRTVTWVAQYNPEITIAIPFMDLKSNITGLISLQLANKKKPFFLAISTIFAQKRAGLRRPGKSTLRPYRSQIHTNYLSSIPRYMHPSEIGVQLLLNPEWQVSGCSRDDFRRAVST